MTARCTGEHGAFPRDGGTATRDQFIDDDVERALPVVTIRLPPPPMGGHMIQRGPTLAPATPEPAGETAWHPERIPFGRHRRRQADAIRHWFAAAPIGSLPPAAEMPSFLGPLTSMEEIAAMASKPATTASDRPWAALRDQLATIAAIDAPIQVEAEYDIDGAWVAYDGAILPYRGTDGKRALLTMVGEARLLAAGDRRTAAAAALAMLGAGAVSSASPWDRGAAPAPAAAPSPSDPWEQARLWAALAATAPVSRATSLHAALDAALGLWRRAPHLPAATVIDRVFAASADAATRAVFAALLEDACRIGIGPGTLAGLLDRAGGAENLLALMHGAGEMPVRAAWVTLTRVEHVSPAGRARPAAIGSTDRIAA